MTRDEFLEKLESLLEFDHKDEYFMYSHNLEVVSSNLFFDFRDTGSCMRGFISYSDILGISLEEDPNFNTGICLHLHLIAGDFYIPASKFNIKTGATVHTVEIYHAPKRAWIVQELKENQVIVVFAYDKEDAAYSALDLLGFDQYDICTNRIPYTIDTLPPLDKWGDALSDKDFLDPANKDDLEILKNYSFWYDDEGHIRCSFRDQAEKRKTP